MPDTRLSVSLILECLAGGMSLTTYMKHLIHKHPARILEVAHLNGDAETIVLAAMLPHRPPEHGPGGRRYSEEKYSFTPADGARSVEQTFAHIAVSTRLWQEAHASGTTYMHDYDWSAAFIEMESDEKKKRSKQELVDLLKNEGERFAGFPEGLSDDKLAEQITEDPGQPAKSRLETLMSPKEHEMHCRSQLMLMERMLGIVPHLTRKYAEMKQEMREAAKKKSGQTAQA